MSLNISDILYAARLACIAMTEEEAEKTLESLNKTVDIIELMKTFDVSGIEPMTHVQTIFLRLREDDVTEENHRNYYQNCAPKVQDGLYLVPTVIE